MTNREAYKDEIIKFSLDGYSWGVNKDTGEPMPCHKLTRIENGGEYKCMFGDYVIQTCYLGKQKWLNEVCVERTVDWTKIPVDTPVKVKTPQGLVNAYFAGMRYGRPTVFSEGRTSRTYKNKNMTSFDWAIGVDPQYLMLDKES